jgi:uncharacterized protein (DUF1697 family)
LRSAILARLGVATPVIIRTHAELAAVIAANPFAETARTHPAAHLTVFLDAPADPAGVIALREAARGGERVEAIGREAFIHYAGGIADSKLTAARIDRWLGSAGTARNLNTVLALEALMAELAAGF